jgi:hypothetical protein
MMGNNNHVVSHKLCGFQGRVGRHNAVRVQIFCQSLLVNSITDSNGTCKLMDCSVTVFVDEISNFFTIFCHFAGA